MTDGPQGDGWWQASDLKWYPPETRPDHMAALPPPPAAQTPAQAPVSAEAEKPAETRQVIPRDKLGVLSKIGQGGQGVVYAAPNVKTKFAASMVFKEYKIQVLADIDFTALAAMPALVEDSLTYTQAERLISIAAWPCALVEEADTPKGFVMPAIPEQFIIPLTTVKGVSNATAEFQHLLNHPSVVAARGISIDEAQRYSLLREVASGLAFLHKHDVCVGDISPKNLLFSLAPHAAVYFIDCDAMRINGASVLRQVETPGWQVPAGENLATIYSDTYKLGLLALRLLVGDHDTTNPQHIPSTAPDMLRQVVTDTLTNPPQRRPLPEAWTYVLGDAIEAVQHRQKAAAAAPVNVAPVTPPGPVVRSRPATPTTQSTPPTPTPQVRNRPSVGMQSAPPPTPTVHSRSPVSPHTGRLPELWGWVCLTAIIVLVGGLGILLINNHKSVPSSAPTTSSSEAPAPESSPGASPTMRGHYIRTETTPKGRTTTQDLYFTPCGDGCASVAYAPGGQPWGEARLVNGQWTFDSTSSVACPDGTKVADALTTRQTWDPNTLSGTDQATNKAPSCGNPVGYQETNSLQLKQAP
jgi:serine/threonine protein kinase